MNFTENPIRELWNKIKTPLVYAMADFKTTRMSRVVHLYPQQNSYNNTGTGTRQVSTKEVINAAPNRLANNLPHANYKSTTSLHTSKQKTIKIFPLLVVLTPELLGRIPVTRNGIASFYLK